MTIIEREAPFTPETPFDPKLPFVKPISPRRKGPNGDPIQPWRPIIPIPEYDPESPSPRPLIQPPTLPPIENPERVPEPLAP